MSSSIVPTYYRIDLAGRRMHGGACDTVGTEAALAARGRQSPGRLSAGHRVDRLISRGSCAARQPGRHRAVELTNLAGTSAAPLGMESFTQFRPDFPQSRRSTQRAVVFGPSAFVPAHQRSSAVKAFLVPPGHGVDRSISRGGSAAGQPGHHRAFDVKNPAGMFAAPLGMGSFVQNVMRLPPSSGPVDRRIVPGPSAFIPSYLRLSAVNAFPASAGRGVLRPKRPDMPRPRGPVGQSFARSLPTFIRDQSLPCRRWVWARSFRFCSRCDRPCGRPFSPRPPRTPGRPRGESMEAADSETFPRWAWTPSFIL